MDNLCHTLAGFALAEAGFRKRTALATATMVIGANLPDVDILSYAFGPATALGFRRGWTHGLPSMVIWPFVLTGLMMAWDTLVRRRGASRALERAGPPGLLAAAAVAVWSHPVLDYLNTYGMRWLMPLSGRWWYGDTLFIVDPWVWLVLAAGALWARWRGARGHHRPARPARVALALVGGYVLLMGASNVLARRAVLQSASESGLEIRRLMVAPVPANPLERLVVFELDQAYGTGSLSFTPRPVFTWGNGVIPRGDAAPAARWAAATPQGRTYLSWARFPFFAADGDNGCRLGTVCIRDARYFPQTWAEVVIPLGQRLSLEPRFRLPETP